jgi:hypothetical protein
VTISDRSALIRRPGDVVSGATGGRRDWRGAYTRIASGARRARQSPSRHAAQSVHVEAGRDRLAVQKPHAALPRRPEPCSREGFSEGEGAASGGGRTRASPWGREAQGVKPGAQRKARGRTAGIGGVGGRRFYAMKPPAGLQGSGVAVASRRIKLSSVKAQSAESL